MTSRELFHNIMHYGEFDRMPVYHWTGWHETIERWHREGLPEGAEEREFFHAEWVCRCVPVNLDLFPLFEEETIEETPEYRIFRQNDGVTARHWKGKSCIPHYLDFLLKDPSGWPEYKKRLQPDPARLPDGLDQKIDELNACGQPVTINAASMAGWLRNWMGVENMAMASMIYPDFFAETVDTISNLVCWGIDQVCPKLKLDLAWGWEDICFKTGPLIHPGAFKEFCVPGYRKIADKLRSYGCDLYLVDCDGMIDHLIPHWLDAGVNIMFPVEIGAWNADPMALRRKYGKELRIIGGINKLALERTFKDIDDEIERRRPLMAEGGFIPMPDHLITPATPLANVQHYLQRIRELRFPQTRN